MLRRPCSRRTELRVDALRVPVIFAVTKQVVARWIVGDRVEQELYGFRRRRIRYVLVERKIRTSPRRALMCERERFVVMKVINHIPVGIRFEKQHLGESRPAM